MVVLYYSTTDNIKKLRKYLRWKNYCKNLKGKLRILKFTKEETATVLKIKNQRKIERHSKRFQSLIDEFHGIKVEYSK